MDPRLKRTKLEQKLIKCVNKIRLLDEKYALMDPKEKKANHSRLISLVNY